MLLVAQNMCFRIPQSNRTEFLNKSHKLLGDRLREYYRQVKVRDTTLVYEGTEK